MIEAARSHIFSGFKGLQLVADRWGSENGWPVLLMHGGGQTRHAWQSTAQRLAANDWLAVTIDLRGHGESDWAADGDYAFGTFAKDCLDVIDTFDRPPVLVGASLGGITALLAEMTRPGPVSSALILVDVTPTPHPPGVRRIRDFMASGLDGFASLDDAATAIAQYTRERQREPNHAGLAKVLRLREDGRWHWHWDPRVLAARDGADIPVDDGHSVLRPVDEKIDVPTLLVRGLESDVVTDETVRSLDDYASDVTIAEIPNAGHMVAGDQNDLFSSAVLDFLATHVSPILGHGESIS